jgi:hypothetical protein
VESEWRVVYYLCNASTTKGKKFAFFDPQPYVEVFLALDAEVISLCPRMVEAGRCFGKALSLLRIRESGRRWKKQRRFVECLVLSQRLSNNAP